jgi:hypothetical protein
VERNQAGLAKLCLADGEDALAEVHIRTPLPHNIGRFISTFEEVQRVKTTGSTEGCG